MKLKMQYALLGAGLIAAPMSAKADVNGLYVSLGGGFDLMSPVYEKQAYSGTLSPNPGFPINVGNVVGSPGYGHVGPTYYNTGPVFSGSIGYGFSNSVRLELEGSYSTNGVTRLNNGLTPAGLGTDPLGLAYTGKEKKYSLLANVIIDLNDISKGLGLPFTPYFGAGVGGSVVDWHGVTRRGAGENFTGTTPSLGIVQTITNAFHSDDLTLAVQGIAGASYDIPGVPGLAATADFRMFVLPQGFSQNSHLTLNFRSTPTPFASTLTGAGSSNWGSEINYRFQIGLRYAFGAPPPPPVVMPGMSKVAPSPVSRSYIVFFDWDKADLTDRAKQIVGEAATNSTKVATTRIEVNGYTDTTGTAQYNQGLSIRRAQTVAAELVKDGVPKAAIAIQGFGETHLLVPTGQGVREPQNRRVEIIIK